MAFDTGIVNENNVLVIVGGAVYVAYNLFNHLIKEKYNTIVHTVEKSEKAIEELTKQLEQSGYKIKEELNNRTQAFKDESEKKHAENKTRHDSEMKQLREEQSETKTSLHNLREALQKVWDWEKDLKEIKKTIGDYQHQRDIENAKLPDKLAKRETLLKDVEDLKRKLEDFINLHKQITQDLTSKDATHDNRLNDLTRSIHSVISAAEVQELRAMKTKKEIA